MSGTVEQIKSRLNIVEVVGSYIKLERAGRHLKARCPFHHEKTPSFFVSPERDSYHCFGCNRGGDIFSFVEEIEGVDFLGALKILAGRAGVTLGPVSDRARTETERLREVLAAATDFFVARLKTEPSAERYLAERGLSSTTIETWRLGWAPAAWRTLFEHLSARGFPPALLEQSGLVVSRAGGGHFDRFRGRVMFPLFDAAGRPVAFSGRYLAPAPGEKASGAKYLNSPESPIYHKSSLLYGYDRAKLAIRERQAVILVEGQFDLVLAHQAGSDNTVAVSGTALTANHLQLLKRLTNTVIMIYDPDEAGVRAARRSIGLALAEELDVRLSLLPDGQDPAALIKKDPVAWQSAVAGAKPAIDFLLEALGRQTLDQTARLRRIREEIYPLLAALPHRAETDFCLQKIADDLGSAVEVMREDFVAWRERQATTRVPASPLAAMPANAPTTRRAVIEERLFGVWFWQSEATHPELDLKAMRQALLQVAGEAGLENRLQVWGSNRQSLALAAEIAFQGVADLALEWRELTRNWQRELWREELNQALLKLKQAEGRGDEAAIDKYLKKCHDITHRLSHFENGQETIQKK